MKQKRIKQITGRKRRRGREEKEKDEKGQEEEGKKRDGRRGGEEGGEDEEGEEKKREKEGRRRRVEGTLPTFPNQFLALSSLGYSSIFRICSFSEFE